MSTELSPALREQIENTIRGFTIDAIQRAGIGHLGAAMGLARPAFQLWDRHLRFDPQDPDWPLRDRFVLSGGHASMLLYSLLHLYGYDLPIGEIENFRQLGSKTPGHPEYGETPGVEGTTGPLGQGLGNAVGMALAGRVTRARFAEGDRGPGHHFVYAVAGDGDLMEGVSYEASSLAGHLGLGNLIVLYDDNKVTIDGPTDLTFSENVRGRFDAQTWHVQEIDGEDVAALDRALEAARAETERPSLVITRTTIGYGSPNWAGKSKAHGGPFKDGEDQRTKENLGIPLEPEFHVGPEVRAYLADRVEVKGRERQAADQALGAWRAANPERAGAWDAARGRTLPGDLVDRLVDGLEGEAAATRVHSGTVIQRLAAAAPIWLGGSADLAGSNNTTVEGADSLGPAAEGDPFAGTNLHFGVREHAMGAITNGIALDGTFLPFCATFLVFSDYMRPSVRLAALMQCPSIFVFTHDSIFVGEDGPTHQPVEHVDALRAIPGLTVFRPADGIEVALAWAWTATQARGPVALALSRQKVPGLKREAGFSPRDVWKGAYCVHEPEGGPDVVVLGSGSEVALACEAASALAADGIRARVVSVPSLELLDQQDEAYVEGLVPRDVPCVAVEAGRGESFRRLVGRDGLIHGMTGFGKSAPYSSLAEHFGFTPGKLADAIRRHLRS
ncbi:MAG: transketolase [Deltaproteobacteria bacterium]|nr:transketolase [Deltaproteobacteria bacterium]